MNIRIGGRILADGLKLQGVDTVFAVPGESYLALLDGLYDTKDSIRLITCRHEGGAANMAEAYGKLTGNPGVCMVTRGPGAANSSIGLHTAFQDSTPMILLVGQVERNARDREAFQEIEHRIFFSELSKWSAEILDPARIPEYLSHAFHLAMSGRPGPVVLSLPEDMLHEKAAIEDAPKVKRIHSSPHPEEMLKILEVLKDAKRPLIILGGGGWTTEACKLITVFAEKNQLPVAVSFRCQDRFNNDHHCYVGDLGIVANPKLYDLVRDSDLLIVIGARIGETSSGGYKLLNIPVPNQKLIHVHPGADELGRVYQGSLLINASVSRFAEALDEIQTVPSSGWAKHTKNARKAYEAFQQIPEVSGRLNLGKVISHLSDVLPDDALITNGAGTYSAWGHRFYRFHNYPSQLGPTSGAMGYGLPAAIAAKLIFPERETICLAGDGCFMMSVQELATAVQYGLNLVIIVFNNGMYGTIRMHQERNFPGRVYGTELKNPDFVALARAYGAFGERVEFTEDFPEAFNIARSAGCPALLELIVDQEAITPNITLSDIRKSGMSRKIE